MGSSSSREAREAQQAAFQAQQLLDQQKLHLLDNQFWELARSCTVRTETCSVLSKRFEKLLLIFRELALRPQDYLPLRDRLGRLIDSILDDERVDAQLDSLMSELGLVYVEESIPKVDLFNPRQPELGWYNKYGVRK